MSGRRKKRSAPDLARLAALREIVREGTENRPGVYRMFAENGEVLYVGKSKAVRTRLLSYFRSEWPQDKGARLIADAHRVDWDGIRERQFLDSEPEVRERLPERLQTMELVPE